MAFSDLIPWGRDRNQPSGRRNEDDNPLMSLQRDLNRVFEDFWSRFDSPFGSMATNGPRTDISETDEAMLVSVDLPGLDDKDVEVNVTDDMLTIRGEREEKAEKDGFTSQSRRSFHRMIPVPPGVDAEKAEAEANIDFVSVTPEVSHALMSSLKDAAPEL